MMQTSRHHVLCPSCGTRMDDFPAYLRVAHMIICFKDWLNNARIEIRGERRVDERRRQKK